jgi:hypothetical protein
MPISYLLPLLSHHGIKTCLIKLIYISSKREKKFLHDVILSNTWDALRHTVVALKKPVFCKTPEAFFRWQ